MEEEQRLGYKMHAILPSVKATAATGSDNSWNLVIHILGELKSGRQSNKFSEHKINLSLLIKQVVLVSSVMAILRKKTMVLGIQPALQMSLAAPLQAPQARLRRLLARSSTPPTAASSASAPASPSPGPLASSPPTAPASPPTTAPPARSRSPSSTPRPPARPLPRPPPLPSASSPPRAPPTTSYYIDPKPKQREGRS